MGRLLEREELLARLEATRAERRAARVRRRRGRASARPRSSVRSRDGRRPRACSTGACEASRPPTPLGPFVDVAARAGGRACRRSSRRAPSTRSVALAAAARSSVAPAAARARGPPLGRRGEPRRAAASSGGASTACPGARASRRTATTRSRGHPLRRGCSASSPLRSGGRAAVPCRGSRSRPSGALSPSGRARRRARCYELTGGNAFYVTEVLAAAASALPATVRDAVLARAAVLDAVRAAAARRRPLSSPRAPSCGCSRPWPRRDVARLDACLPLRDAAAPSRTPSRSGTSLLASPSRARVPPHRAPRRPRRDPRRARRASGRPARPGATGPSRRGGRRRACGCCGTPGRPPSARSSSARTARRPRSSRARFATAPASHARERREAARRVRAGGARRRQLSRRRSRRGSEAIAAQPRALRRARCRGQPRAAADAIHQPRPRTPKAEQASLRRDRRCSSALPSRAPSSRAAYGYQAYVRMLGRDNYEASAAAEGRRARRAVPGSSRRSSLALNMIGHVVRDGGRRSTAASSTCFAARDRARHGIEVRIASVFTMLGSGLGEMYELERGRAVPARAVLAFADEYGLGHALRRSWLAGGARVPRPLGRRRRARAGRARARGRGHARPDRRR